MLNDFFNLQIKWWLKSSFQLKYMFQHTVVVLISSLRAVQGTVIIFDMPIPWARHFPYGISLDLVAFTFVL